MAAARNIFKVGCGHTTLPLGDCHKLKSLHHYAAMNFFSDGRE